jgi:hypothetical protein
MLWVVAAAAIRTGPVNLVDQVAVVDRLLEGVLQPQDKAIWVVQEQADITLQITVAVAVVLVQQDFPQAIHYQ